ncbi:MULTISPECIES: sulfotransferase family 2 domain-containing protein [unclassified Coleofasciculus]|uniref:sulfotransferase family 2 domain-containing protein n=1 Tax=unclassified Coleofasciculus TaxID=2692782 RepID=UPI0018830049|nr:MULTISPECIES: sulfotransferase family 2 domain-containing protein [unclassified Coleofasciculus]MBE9125331.1 sulfotransferase family 2 domain-containing protein [Coleofasciculus sp. LEGE 07081]MBE9148534.1 sulfotransferase family 2 domain-containing protein [Coleofasciculus sp. LEGE 07092]
MIISHKHRYLFIQLPRSGSTSIGRELCEQYDGQKILSKHSPYHEFLKIANSEEKKYFVFSCIRNPLDVVVSQYVQMKDDNWGVYTNPKNWKSNGGWISKYQLSQFNFINNKNADFPAFFKKYYKFTYDNWSCLAHKKYDFVIRFEYIQNDFDQALKLIGIEQKRPLPNVNKTKSKDKNCSFSFYTPDIQNHAREVFSPFMKKWGYEFPVEWGNNSFSWFRQLEYDFFSIPRKFYWRYLKRYK